MVNTYDFLELFKRLPHLDGYQRVISDGGGTPLIYTILIVNGMLVGFSVKMVNFLQDFNGKTPEEAIDNAFKWCKEKELI